jgi:hypothetical protein
MIISSPELGIMIKINMPKVHKIICKHTLPYITFIGWGSKPQSPAYPVQIHTQSTDSYREPEYPEWITAWMSQDIHGGTKSVATPHD